MKPKHVDDVCLNMKFMEWPELPAIVEGQVISMGGANIEATRVMAEVRKEKRKKIDRHNKIVLEKKKGTS